MSPITITLVAFSLLASGLPAGAADCIMENARYVEPRSGAVLQFLPLPFNASPMDNNILTLTFPNASEPLTGNVAWTNGRRTIPYMAIRHACSQEDIDTDRKDSTGLCRLWDGSVYAITDGSADWIPGATDAAADGLLLPDFGDALVQWPDYYSVTDRSAWDAFEYIGCSR